MYSRSCKVVELHLHESSEWQLHGNVFIMILKINIGDANIFDNNDQIFVIVLYFWSSLKTTIAIKKQNCLLTP